MSQPAVCMLVREDCGHVCKNPHPAGRKCPSRCNEPVTSTCECGSRTEIVPCGSSSRESYYGLHSVTLKKLLEAGRPYNIMAKLSISKLKNGYLPCDGNCKAPSTFMEPTIFLAEQARKDPQFVTMIEDCLHNMVVRSLDKEDIALSGRGLYSFRFTPMSSKKRKVIHELAQRYGCKSESYCQMPHRYTVVCVQKYEGVLPNRVT